MQSSCYFSIQHSNNMMQQGHWWLSQRSQTIFIAFFQTFVQPSQSNFNVTLHYWVISFHFCGLFTNTLFCSRFLKQYGTHHAKADSSWILFASAYSANSIGFVSFISLRSIQVVVTARSMGTFHPFIPNFQFRWSWPWLVIPFAVVNAGSSFRWSIIS